ncbi:MAG: magnesium/cobalt transporter CorA [Coriobacteriia bacterium]|nr:magnesium/cobalt transporter CorA [Coriobacteriia bacterium]
MSARVTARWIDDGVLRSDGLDALPAGLAGPLWIDVFDPDEETFAAIGARVPLPPLAVEDCLHSPQRPKLDSYHDLTFVVWLLPQLSGDGGLVTQEIGLFMTESHLVTVHRLDLPALSRVIDRADVVLARGVEWTVHAILDAAVDEIFPVVELLSDELEEIEDLVLAEARPEYLQRLYGIRRSLVALHRVVNPQSDVVRGLARLEVFVEPDAYMYFDDIGDHLARLDDTIDIYRDVAGGVMDLFVSVQSNRMNGIMKQLTVVATIFMPLTLISGIYGMNVIEGMWPPAHAGWSFGLIIVGMMFIAAWMALFFRRNDWW